MHFFHFLKVLIFWDVSGVKEQNMAQNDKKLCQCHSVSHMILVFGTHVKWIFLFFQNSDFLKGFFFWRGEGIKAQK